MASKRLRTLMLLTLGCGLASFGGCRQDSDPPPPPELKPVTGKVTVEGKPLVNAVVTFLQTDEFGTTAVGETDSDGDYELSYMGETGVAAGKYKVAISYLEGPDGTIYGLGPRSGLAKPYGMTLAKERLGPEWSDLGRTKQTATVSTQGGTINFEIKDPLLPPPAPAPPASTAKGGEEPATVPPIPAETKASAPTPPADPAKPKAP
ncbi:carboxypeptidase-like regulatory domain-containing protein [Singulisphaera rosea]